MRRRDFIKGIAGAIVALPVAAWAQQPERMRRVGVIMSLAPDDPEDRGRVAALRRGLQQVGWTDGRNLQLDFRWPAGDADRVRKYVAELVALAPDVILTTGDTTGPVQKATQTVPIVFVLVADPISAGYVMSLNKPGGNTTGFSFVEYGICGKWLELLKQVAPNVARVAILRDAAVPTGNGQFDAIQAVAPSFGVQLIPVGVRDANEIERGLSEISRGSNAGMIVTATTLTIIHRELIGALASRLRVPAVYGFNTTSGGVISYAPDTTDQYRRAAQYIDRILKGEKPGDLPVQNPTKFKLVINLKTAKALGLTVPQSLQATADEVIE